ncbi:flagellar assembly protein A [Bacillota bacterium Lsc_1132]
MQSIISKGKNVKQAINLGLELLEAKKEEVTIEVIQHETKGFLGLGSKNAIVKIIKNKSKSASPSNIENDEELLILESLSEKENVSEETKVHTQNLPEEEKPELLEGKVWVKDGRLFCKSSQAVFPTVTIPDGVKLYKNQQLVTEKSTIVTDQDFYEINVENEEKQTIWDVSLDQSKLKVLLKVEPGYRLLRSILDVEPDSHILLKVDEQKEIMNTLLISELMLKLEALGVKYGIKHDEMMRAVKTTVPGTYEIATGLKPKEGKNGWIELKVNMETQKGPKLKENGKVDFRDIQSFPTVEKGKVIAIIHPPISGEPGCTVTNESIPCKKSFPITLKTGQGVTMVEDKIVATSSGRPDVKQRGQLVKISIMPKLTHAGNVDLVSGNIRFIGDVEIVGEVNERMSVEAEGDLIVHKTTNMAQLVSSGAIITYGNIVGSEVSAGKNNIYVAELGHLLGILHQNIEKIIGVIRQLTLSSAFKSNDLTRGGLQPLIRILLEKKFKSFPPLVKKYVDVVRRGEAFLEEGVWREISLALTQIFLTFGNEIISLERIIQLSEKMKKIHEISKAPLEPDSFITIPSAQNSQLYCSGNVLVLGQGCINTKIHAGGSVKINGIIRGGSVYGRLGVEINEAGAESGTSTIIAVPSDQKIIINKAMEGTLIQIGNAKRKVDSTIYHLKASLDDQARIIFN